MNLDHDRFEARRVARVLLVVLAASLVLGGCSALPSWADPSDWFAKDEALTKVGPSPDQAGQLQSAEFPNLAGVPDTAPAVTHVQARARIRETLAADRANAQYSGERLVGATPARPPVPDSSASAAPVQPARVGQAAEKALAPVPPVRAQTPKVLQTAAPGAPPPAPIAAELITPAKSPPSPARTQVVQNGTAKLPGRKQRRFSQFQSPQLQFDAAAMAPGPAATGAQLVAVIYFGHGSTRLDADDRGVLRNIVALHKQRGGVIRVIGHSSARTGVVAQSKHRMVNFETSKKRASTVAAEIVALGVAKDRVRAEARGDTQPVYHEFMPTGEAGNRRTEIFLEY